ncbi:MAG: aminotransferase class IV [Bacteroidota bacterium]
METNAFVIYDNKLFKADAPVLNISNRAFRFGDALFETIKVIDSEPLFVDLHIERISNAMQLLGMLAIPDLTVDNLVAQIKILLKRNNCEKSARVRFTIFRKDGGFYTPITNQVSYTIEAYPLSVSDYEWNAKGLQIGFYKENLKPINNFSKIKSANALLYVLASQYAQANKFDDVFLLNTNHAIIESSNSNLFYFLNGRLYTPPLADGCLSGIMRFIVLALAIENEIEIEERSLYIDDIPFVKEAFLTNTLRGIVWISGINDARYFNHTARQFYELLLQKLNQLSNKNRFLV